MNDQATTALPPPDRPELSVIVPIYNEEETLPELERRLLAALTALGETFEVILVNDGSRDDSLALLAAMAGRDRRVRVIDFSRNFGHQAAFYAGIRRAGGRAVVLMDGDLQDPPEAIADLVAKWREGYEVVYAIREKRKEGMLKRAAYSMFYRLLRSIAYVEIPLDAGDFALMDERVVRLLRGMRERNKFLRGLRSWVGFRQTGLVCERGERFAGRPKYSLRRLFRLAFDGLIAYSYVPLRIAFVLGLVVSAASFLLAAVYFVQRLVTPQEIPKGFTTLAILVLFLGGIQLLTIGLLGEYLGRIYDEVKARPLYLVADEVGGETPPPEKPAAAPRS
jgi:dolichol-phosphate mannosyltransferase